MSLPASNRGTVCILGFLGVTPLQEFRRDGNPQSLCESELHAHVFGCYSPADLLAMSRDCCHEIDWHRFDFLARFERAYGVRLDPAQVIERALATGSLDELRSIAVFGAEDAGDFERFDVKSFFAIAITGYHLDHGNHEILLAPLLGRQSAEGVTYAEYRCGFGPTIFAEWHTRFARYFASHSTAGSRARSIVRLNSSDALGSYTILRQLLDDRPDLYEAIVGVDFSGREVPPKSLAAFFARLRSDNAADPEHGLDAVVHIGEVFYDRSVETAIRWCHEAAELGAKRLGHCIALGLDPRVAVSRRPDAHTAETVSERLDQIAYDLAYAPQLREYGVPVDREKLRAEQRHLETLTPTEMVRKAYDETRLEEAARRQDFVLDRLTHIGTVIEVCPTSNLRIGGIPDFRQHPVWRFLRSGVNMAICSDDPGIFDSSLAAEVDSVAALLAGGREALSDRVGDPFRFRLAAERQ